MPGRDCFPAPWSNASVKVADVTAADSHAGRISGKPNGLFSWRIFQPQPFMNNIFIMHQTLYQLLYNRREIISFLSHKSHKMTSHKRHGPSVSVHSSIDICDTFKYKFYHNSVKKFFSASGFSALGALKSCASKHVVFGIFILPEAKLREKKR